MQKKSPIKSGTIWAIVVAAVISIASALGVDLSPLNLPEVFGVEKLSPQAQAAIDNLIFILISLVAAAWRRWVAKEPLGKPPAKGTST